MGRSVAVNRKYGPMVVDWMGAALPYVKLDDKELGYIFRSIDLDGSQSIDSKELFDWVVQAIDLSPTQQAALKTQLSEKFKNDISFHQFRAAFNDIVVCVAM